MSKKYFKSLASNLRESRPMDNWCPNKKVQWTLCVRAVARTCKEENPRFDFERFYTACGGLFE